METPSLVRCLLAPPLMRILESAADTGADAAQIGLLCRAVHRRLWISSEGAGSHEAPSKLLLAPSIRLGPQTSPACFRRFSPASLRRLSVHDAPAAFLPGNPWQSLLRLAAPSLEQLVIVIRRGDVQDRWADILGTVAEALEANPSERLHRFQVHGRRFPEAACQALARVARSCRRTLRLFVADFTDFPEDSAGAVLEDGELWDALSEASSLEVLRLAGLRLSSESCDGLARILRSCGGRLRELQLGGFSASALLMPSSAMAEGALRQPELSSEMAALVAEGKQQALRLTSLALTGLRPPRGLHSFGAVAPNLRALLGAIEELAPGLTELNLSDNALLTEEGFQPELLAILENSGPLERLDLSGSNLCLSSAASALHRSSLTLTSLALSGCDEPMPGPTGSSPFGYALQAVDALQDLDIGDLGSRPWLRKSILTALQRAAPTLRCLRAQRIPAAILKIGLSSVFETGTCLEGGARQLQDVELDAGGPCDCLVPIFGAAPLRRLRLAGDLGDGPGAKLVQALRGKPLAELSLPSCRLGSNTARYLAVVQKMQPWPLEVLNLSGNGLGAEAAELLKAFATGKLRSFRLQRCALEENAMAPLGIMVVRAAVLEVVDVRLNPRLRGADARRQFLRAAELALGDPANDFSSAWPHEALIPGRLDLRISPGEVDDNDASQPLPRNIGRFQILQDNPGAANG